MVLQVPRCWSMALLVVVLPMMLGRHIPVVAAADAQVLPVPPWGDSLFGEWEVEGSQYRLAGTNDVRHIGWSWGAIHTMTPPCSTAYRKFANESTGTWAISACSNPDDACQAVGGSLFQDICMETDPDRHPFAVVGPECWQKNCSISNPQNTQKVCEEELGGQWVYPQAFSTGEDVIGADQDGVFVGGSYCLVPGKHTVFGPACYGATCYTDSLRSVCQDKLGGTVYGDLYCVMDPKYTVVGPICRPDAAGATNDDPQCYPEETAATCAALGGEAVGDGVFCILPSEDNSILGPFCMYELGQNFTECLNDEGLKACNSLGGTPFGDGLFCAIQGSDYHYYADFFKGCVGIGDIDSGVCQKELGGMSVGSCGCIWKGDYTVGAPLRWGDVTLQPERDMWYDITHELAWSGGIGFILKGSYTLYGPNCYGSTCYIGGVDDCEKAGGVSIAGIFCGVPTAGGSSKESLSSGMIAVLSVLSVLLFVQSVVMVIWWRRRTAANPSMETAPEAPPAPESKAQSEADTDSAL